MDSFKKRRLVFLLVAALGLAISGSAHASAPPTAVQNNGRGHEQRFENPHGWDLRRLATSVSTTDVVEVVAELEVADDVITVGVLPQPGDDAKAIEASILATLADMASSEGEGAVAAQSASPQVTGSYRAALASAERATPRITRVTLRPGARVPALLRTGVVDDLASTDPSVATVAQDERVSALAAATCGDPWWPDYIKVIAKTSTVSGERYGRLYFQWTTNARLDRLKACENSSFEPDYVTSNYDGRHYFSSTIRSWTSNLPNAYQDTTFGDGADEPTYTVGTPNTRDLAADKEYTTYFRAKNGNYSTDTAKANAQRGVRIPPACTSTWCIFARDTERFPSSGWLSIPSSGWTVYK